MNFKISCKLTYEEYVNTKIALKIYRNLCNTIGDTETKTMAKHLYNKISSSIKAENI